MPSDREAIVPISPALDFGEYFATVCPVCGKKLADHRVSEAEWSVFTHGLDRGNGRLNMIVVCVFAWPGE